MTSHLRPALVVFVALTLVTGGVYPLLVTGLAAAVASAPAEGSFVRNGKGEVVGSALVGQPFTDNGNLWGRPSATSPAYNGAASSGANLGPSSPALAEAFATRAKALRDADPTHRASIPVDLLTASGSGLDPHISPAGAAYQVPRIAAARKIPEATVRDIIAAHTEGRTFGVLGEPRVNVLLVNLDLNGTLRNP